MPILQAFSTRVGARDLLCADYARCFVEILGSRPERIRIQVIAIDPAGVHVAGEQGADLAMVHAYLLPGRTIEKKAALIAALARATATHTSLDDARIRVLLHEIPSHDIGFGALTAQALGF